MQTAFSTQRTNSRSRICLQHPAAHDRDELAKDEPHHDQRERGSIVLRLRDYVVSVHTGIIHRRLLATAAVHHSDTRTNELTDMLTNALTYRQTNSLAHDTAVLSSRNPIWMLVCLQCWVFEVGWCPSCLCFWRCVVAVVIW